MGMSLPPEQLRLCPCNGKQWLSQPGQRGREAAQYKWEVQVVTVGCGEGKCSGRAATWRKRDPHKPLGLVEFGQ
jgi:hypothetical protein